MIFIDYTTIHPDISKNSFNQCKTLIHETGHIFGLKHIFYNDKESSEVYKILLGKIIYEREFINDIKKDKKNKIYLDDIAKIFNDITKNNENPNQLYTDIPYQKKPTMINPIKKNDYQIINNKVCNFCCFMDYSPDSVLTHFTESQKRIMHYFIIIFKPYLIENSKKLESKLVDNKIRYNINENIELDNEKKNIKITEYLIEYDIENFYKYKIL